MKQLKRLTSVLLVLGIVLGLMPLSAFAAEPENTAEKTFPVTVSVTGGENTYNYTLLNDGTYNYTLLNDGTAELTGFLPGVSVADAVIPSAVKGHPVTSIGESAFVNCTALQSVRFEAPIKSIGTIAFGFCTGLTSIALPEGLETIGQSAFAYCTSLASVTIPQSIQVIKFGAFNYGPGTDKKLQELYYTGTETQWDELMKKKISHWEEGHDYTEEIGKMNPMLTEIDKKNFYCAHTVSFDCGSQAEKFSRVVQYGGFVTPPDDPKADGYRFEGWYTQENGGVPFDFEQEITKDVTVYAHWSVKPTPTPDPKPNPDPNPDPNPNPDAKEYTLTEKDGTLVRVTVEKNGTTVDITKNVVLEQQGTTQIGKIPAGAMVTVAANAAPEGMVFAQWNISDPALMGNPDVAHTSQTMRFPMPAADVTVEAMYESAENARETELLGSAAMIGAVGISAVVLAYQAHQLGTELYLKYLLPSGAALPQNRIQLAELLWKNAGEPVPDVNAMYEDIGLNEEAAQQAAQWAVENELIELPDEEHTEQFKPDEQISYGEAIRAWKKAQQLKTAE